MEAAAAAGTTTANSTQLEYFKALPPASTLAQGFLTFCAVLTILQVLLRCLYSCSSRTKTKSKGAPTSTKPAASQKTTSRKVHWIGARHPRDQERYRTPRQTLNQPRRTTTLSDTMDDRTQRASHFMPPGAKPDVGITGAEPAVNHGPSSGDPWLTRAGGFGWHQPLMSRPPPAPPLTPPELSSTIFTLEGRPQIGDSFIHQPNPDYTSATADNFTGSPSTSTDTDTVTAEPPPRRLSYHKTVPIGVPASVSRQSSTSESDLMFSASSYPPTSPWLSPAPPSRSQAIRKGDAAHGNEISLHGEILSVVDGNGAGWSRHTRVYGGGMCLACAASGKDHGEGGFYGPNVLPEEMR